MKQLSISILFICFFFQSALVAQFGVLQYDEEKAMDGYIFFSSTHNEESYLIDNCGLLINTWPGTDGGGLSSNLMPNGKVLRVEETTGSCCSQYSVGGRIQLLDWEGNLEWEFIMSNDDFVQHHDFSLMPNGNILVIGWELIDVATQEDLGRENPVAPYLWGEFIYELEPIGTDDANVVWEWHLQDHFVQDIFPDKDNFGDVSEEIGKLDINYPGPSIFQPRDWFHCNAIDYNPDRDEIILNSRNIHEMWIIDHSTTSEEAKGSSGGDKGKGGDFIFRWGNPTASQNGDISNLKMFGSHGHEWIKPGLPNEGKILFFNNGEARPEGYYSTAEMIDPKLDTNGNYVVDANNNFETDEHRVIYGADPFSLYSEFLSNVQQLENGNFFINEGGDGRYLEVTDDGEVVWEYVTPIVFGNPIGQESFSNRFRAFRAYKYRPDYPGFDGKDLTPGDYIEVTSLDICELLSSDLDGDGFIGSVDCDDNDPNITIPGAECDDGNPNTFSDIIDPSCNCIGECMEFDDIVITCERGSDFIDYTWEPIPLGVEYKLSVLVNGDLTQTTTTETEFRLEDVTTEDEVFFVISGSDISGCTVITSINNCDEQSAGSNLNIYPNPVQDLLTIGNVKFLEAKIFDATGRNLRVTVQGDQIVTSHLSSGVYFLSLIGEDGEYLDVQKFVKF